MIYVRDRGSTSGTYVNGKLIGGREEGDEKVSPGRILRHGDVVSVGEDVKFEVVHPFIPKLRLNEVQTKEVLVSLSIIWYESFIQSFTDKFSAIPRQIRRHKLHDRKRRVCPGQPRH